MPKAVEWVELAAYARTQGIPARTLLRRLTALHAQQGNVLKAHNAPGTRVRKWLVNVTSPHPTAPLTCAQTIIAEQHRRLDRAEVKLVRLHRETLRMQRRLLR